MSSNNVTVPSSIKDKTREILNELALAKETTLTSSDVTTIMKRLERCDNAVNVYELITGDAPEGEHKNTNEIESLAQHSLFYAGGLDNGFEKAVEIVIGSEVTQPQSYTECTEQRKRELHERVKEVDHMDGHRARYEERSTWVTNDLEPDPEYVVGNSPDGNNGDNNHASEQSETVDRDDKLSEYDKRKRDLKKDLL